MFDPTTELFAPMEIAQAAHVSEARVLEALAGEARFLDGDEATALGKQVTESAYFATVDRSSHRAYGGLPLILSGTAHLSLVTVFALLLAPGPPSAAQAAPAPLESSTRLVYLNLAGPGGGGGGGGHLQPAPPRRARNAGPQAMKSPAPPVAKPIEVAAPPVAPLDAEPMPTVLAPIVPMPGDATTRAGALEDRDTESLGAGKGGVAGGGQGKGVGNGQGSGIDEGSGGGTGGGPFRPGAGIQPPRLLREIKPAYSDEARRLGIAGEVLLEIVVQRDGRVGTVRLLRGLRPDLNNAAIDAVRQWQFAPATRGGQPVDLLVEVAVGFHIR